MPQLLAGILVGLVASPALAADRVTCGDQPTEGCFPTLAEAVQAAVEGDRVLVEGGIYAESLTLTDRDVTLEPVSTARRPYLVGDGQSASVFTVTGGTLDVQGPMGIGSPTGRALELSGGAQVTLTGVDLTGVAELVDGGILLARDATLRLDEVVFRGGRALRSGGQVAAFDTELTIVGSRFQGGQAARGGGLFASFGVPGTVEISDSTFVEALGGFGTAVYLTGEGAEDRPFEATIRRSTFERNQTESAGVVHIHHSTGSATITDSVFNGNVGQAATSTLGIHDVVSTTLRRNLFCGGSLESTDTDGTAILIGLTDTFEASNNQFKDIRATALLLRGPIARAKVNHNHFIGNVAPGYPVMSSLFGVTTEFRNNLVASNRGRSSFAVPIYAPDPDAFTADHNLWWDNEPEMVRLAGEGDVRADPGLDAYVPAQRCEYIGAEDENLRDPLWPSWYGAGRDAGSVDQVDRDGSPADIGAFGGLGARLLPDWEDQDADGVPTLYDCDRLDDELGSGLPDPPYDGIDQDCRGDDDFDADDDGYRPAEYVLRNQIADCDDEDARRSPGLMEVASNGIDDDCDGWADNTGSMSPGTCTQSPASTWLWHLVPFVLLRRHR